MGFKKDFQNFANKNRLPQYNKYRQDKKQQKKYSLEQERKHHYIYLNEILEKFGRQIQNLPARKNLKRLLKKIVVGIFLGEKIEQDILFINDIRKLLGQIKEDTNDQYYTLLIKLLEDIYLLALDRQFENSFQIEYTPQKTDALLQALKDSLDFRIFYYYYDCFDEIGYNQTLEDESIYSYEGEYYQQEELHETFINESNGEQLSTLVDLEQSQNSQNFQNLAQQENYQNDSNVLSHNQIHFISNENSQFDQDIFEQQELYTINLGQEIELSTIQEEYSEDNIDNIGDVNIEANYDQQQNLTINQLQQYNQNDIEQQNNNISHFELQQYLDQKDQNI